MASNLTPTTNLDDFQCVFDTVLANLVSTTQADFGLICEANCHQNTLTINTQTDSYRSAYGNNAPSTHSADKPDAHTPLISALIEEVITQQQAVIHNQVSDGIIANLLGVPLFDCGQCAGVVVITRQNESFAASYFENNKAVFSPIEKLMGIYLSNRHHDKQQQELLVSQKSLAMSLEAANVGSWCWHVDKDTLTFGKLAATLHGLDPKHTTSSMKEFLSNISTEHKNIADHQIERALNNGQRFELEYSIILPSGEEKVLASKGQLVDSWLGESRKLLGLCWDITERKLAERELTFLSQYDPLTKLANRRLFEQQLAHSQTLALRRNDYSALIVIDINKFKYVNDTIGHSLGDELLVQVAQRLKRTLRNSDFIARIGGDEFAVIATHMKSELLIANVAQKLLSVFSLPFTIQGHEHFCSISVGVCYFSEQDEGVEDLLKKADFAMFEAKKSGGNSYTFFCDELQTSGKQRLKLNSRSYRALERNEFELNYQPQIDLVSGNVAGCEALLRWQDAELGLVPPDQFIPILEENRTIIEVGEWIIEQAAKDYDTLRLQGLIGPDFKMSVNVSPKQLKDSNLLQCIEKVLSKYNIEKHCFCVEITESVLMNDAEKSKSLLQQFQNMGLDVAIDDFGTGYSSLSYLRKYPIDYVKIDREFIRFIGEDPTVESIISAILSLCKALRLKTIAEGVETTMQLEFLSELKCDWIQGFLYSKPLKIEQLKAYIKNNSFN